MDAFLDRIKPYEGPENYVFISYSHRDAERVFPLLRSLSDRGFRLWYDEGIDPGSEWPQSIADHLAGCKVCLAFISSTSVQSKNCRQEINFALANNKDFLSVMLEPVTMPRGMEMQLSIFQFLMSYKYPSREAFEEKLFSVELLQSCRALQAAPAPAVETTPASPVPAAPAAAPEREAPAPAPEVLAPAVEKRGRARKEKKAGKGREPAVPADRAKRRNKRLLALLIPAALILLILLLVLKPFQRRVTINGVTYRNESSLVIRDASVTAANAADLARLDKCTYLSFKDCSFEGGALSSLKEMVELRNLSLISCSGVDDLSCVSAMPKLYSLELTDCGITDSLLSGAYLASGLRTLALGDNQLTKIPELQGITGLTKVNLENNKISDLSALAGCTALTELDLSGNEIAALDSLEACQKLERLDLADNRVRDLSPLSAFIYLKQLDLSGNEISSLEPLSYCTMLSKVDLRGNAELKGLGILEKSAEQLKYLDISGVSDAELSFLDACKALETLNMNACGAKDLRFAAGMTGLRVLNAADNEIEDLGPLKTCGSLTVINLAGNRIRSITGLPAAAAEEGKTSPKLILLLHDNQLERLEGLDPGYYYDLLTLYGNPLKEGGAFADLEGYRLLTEMNGALDPNALKRFNAVYVPEAELEWQLSWEQTLSVKLHYAPMTEALEDALKGLGRGGDVTLPES